MPKKVSVLEIESRMLEKHNNRYSYDLTNYKNTRSIISISCPIHGMFQQKISDHLYAGCGCPSCDITRKFTTDDFIVKSIQVHSDTYDYSFSSYGKNNYDKVKIICKKHGMFEQTPWAHMRGQGCPQCANNHAYSNEDFIKLCKDKHNGIYDYSLVEYTGKNKPIRIVCRYHGEFEQLAKLHLSGYGCKKCKMSKLEIWIKKILDDRQINWEYNKKFDSLKWKKGLSFDFWLPDYRIAIECDGIQHREPVEFFGGKARLDEQIQKDNIKTEWCQQNQVFLIRIDDFVDPFSLIDSKIVDLFSKTIVPEKKNLIKFDKLQKTIFTIDDSQKNEFISFISSISPISSKFELDGEHYIHVLGTNLLFKYIDFFNYSEINSGKKRLADIYNSCNNKGFKVIQIFEDDWRNRRSIIESRILNLLGKSERIWARKCVVREINDHKVMKTFLDATHIQGFVPSKHKLGIFYKDEMVALLTISDLRINLGQKKEVGTFEILRYSCKNSVNVIGGFDKALKFFIKKYEPKKIISYANRMWSNETNVYSKIGMKLESISDPSYFYIIGDKREGRFTFRKDVLLKKWNFPSTMTEHTIMLANSVYRIFDAGCFKYSLSLH